MLEKRSVAWSASYSLIGVLERHRIERANAVVPPTPIFQHRRQLGGRRIKEIIGLFSNSSQEPPTRLAALRALTLVNPRLVVRPRLLRSVGLRLLDKEVQETKVFLRPLNAQTPFCTAHYFIF